MRIFKYRPWVLLLVAISILTAVTALADNPNKDIEREQTKTPSEATASEATTEAETEPLPVKPDGFYKDSLGQYYLQNGKRILNAFFWNDEALYHFDEEGYSSRGWYEDAGGKWYYFNADGKSESGWIKDDENWFYLEDGMFDTGWHEIKDSAGTLYWYYFNENGVMLSDCETPDGYKVNADGVCIEEEPSFGEGFSWNKDKAKTGKLSGLMIAGHPAEFYMLSIAGETSGMSNSAAVRNGDNGAAYGACQLDYRYDLTDFMQYAHEKNPQLWSAFAEYKSYNDGSSALRGNEEIGDAFVEAMSTNYEASITDQLEFMASEYWSGFERQMNAAGFDLENRHVAVSAAMFSVNVNCGPQANIFIKNLSPDMTDEEIIRGVYRLRNTVLANQMVGSVQKGTTTRYRSAEPKMALDLLYGYMGIDSEVNYGGGVEWHGNPFTGTAATSVLSRPSGQSYNLAGIAPAAEATTEAETTETVETEAAETESMEPTVETESEAMEESSEEDNHGKDITEAESLPAGPGYSETETPVQEDSNVIAIPVNQSMAPDDGIQEIRERETIGPSTVITQGTEETGESMP